MRTLVARAPTRLDFGGGWTDVPPYSDEQGGVVCNIAITRFASARLSSADSPAPETPAVDSESARADAHPALVTAAIARTGVRGVHVSLSSDYPIGAGLGGSSAAGVVVVGALAGWAGKACAPEQLAEDSRAIEVEDLGLAGGRQDHYAAAFGGALELRFEGNDTTVRRLALSNARAAELANRLVVAYTGQSRISANTINAVLDAYRDREPRVVGALGRMKQIAESQARAVEGGNFDDLGRLVGEHWRHQRELHPAITTPRIDAAIERAMRAGGLGAKALGASGGGCILVVAAEGKQHKVRDAIQELTEPLAFNIATYGFEVLDESEVTPQ